MKIKLYLYFVFVLSIFCAAITFGREQYWQVKDLVAKADIITIVVVKQLDKKNDDLMIRIEHPNSGDYSIRHNPDYDEFMDVEFLVNDILKEDNKHLHLSTLTIPALKGVGRYPKPVSFIVGARYLVFLEYEDPNRSLESLQLISPTSGAVRLEGNKIIRKPALLDGYPPQFRKFNEPELLQRVQQLITEAESVSSVKEQEKPTGDSSHVSRRCGMVEKTLYRELGLSEDVNDSVIIQLLDVPNKRASAILLIRYRKISSAIPKLLQIYNNNEIFFLEKIGVAEALCDFGNREWMPTIKALSTDPNSIINRNAFKPYKIKIAGLLARAGDYSQFEVVAKGISDSRDYIRFTAVHELGNFGHKTEPITDSAVGLLISAATSDSVPRLRELAIRSLEKIAKKKPEVTSKVIDALEANVDSPDKNLRIICRVKLKSYGRELKKD